MHGCVNQVFLAVLPRRSAREEKGEGELSPSGVSVALRRVVCF